MCGFSALVARAKRQRVAEAKENEEKTLSEWEKKFTKTQKPLRTQVVLTSAERLRQSLSRVDFRALADALLANYLASLYTHTHTERRRDIETEEEEAYI